MLEERAHRTGVKAKALMNRPRLRFEDAAFMQGYYSVHQARTSGHSSPNPLAVTEIAAYCSLLGIASRGERLKYLRLIQDLDQVYLTHWDSSQPSRKAAPTGKTKQRGGLSHGR